jgi:hypothetical protein
LRSSKGLTFLGIGGSLESCFLDRLVSLVFGISKKEIENMKYTKRKT